MNESKTIKRLLIPDADDIPLPPLQSLSQIIRPRGIRHRLPQVEGMLRKRPKDLQAVELYLEEFIFRSLGRRGGMLLLDGLFSLAVNGIGKETLQALPEHTQTALFRLARQGTG